MEEAKVSIIMAVLNGEKTIEKSLESVLNQTYSNTELIVVNDGSTDRTSDIVRELNDARIVLFEQQNSGVSAARNKGLELMTGDYFCFLDADDILPEDSIRSRMEVFANNSEVSFVDGVVEERALNSGKLLRRFTPDFDGNPLKELLQLNDSCFCGQTWLVKVQPNISYEFNEELTHGEDVHFFIELAKNGGNYASVNEVILIYNRHADSAMSNIEGLHAFYQYHLDFLTESENKEILAPSELAKTKKKIRKILFKSYLKTGKLIKALVTIFKI